MPADNKSTESPSPAAGASSKEEKDLFPAGERHSQTTPTQPGPFALHDDMNRIVGTVTIRVVGAYISMPASWPLGREDLRKIGHRLLEIADFDTGLHE